MTLFQQTPSFLGIGALQDGAGGPFLQEELDHALAHQRVVFHHEGLDGLGFAHSDPISGLETATLELAACQKRKSKLFRLSVLI
jgi:hypothetical protein